MTIHHFIFTIICCCSCALLPAQSGWLQDKGQGYSQLSSGRLSTDNYYNLSGDQVTTTRYDSYSINAYLEYGLSSSFNLLLNGPVLRRQSFTTTSATYGIGDVSIGLKYKLAAGRWPAAFSLAAELPLSPTEQFAVNNEQLVPGITDQINLPASDGELNVRSTLAVSHSFSDQWYASFFSGFNFRTEGLSHQVSGGVEIGYLLVDQLYLIGRLNTQLSLGTPQNGLSFVRGEGVEYTAVGFTLSYQVSENWGLNLSATTYNDLLASRRNIYSGPALYAGVSYSW